MTQTEALKLALEEMKAGSYACAIDRLEEALAQQSNEQVEPVARACEVFSQGEWVLYPMNIASEAKERGWTIRYLVPEQTPQPKEPEQEPVAWRFTGIAGLKRYMTQKQYDAQTPETKKWYEPYKCANCTTPPQRKSLPPQLDPNLNFAANTFFALGWTRCKAAHGIKE